MIRLGYMAKFIKTKPSWLHCMHVEKVFSVSRCFSSDFCDWTDAWKHNGYWLFDSPTVIQKIASQKQVDLSQTVLCYYEGLKWEYDPQTRWQAYGPEPSMPVHVIAPRSKTHLGFDVVTYSQHNAAECSPLSCNELCKEVKVNKWCLLDSFEEAMALCESDTLTSSEPGPYRIISVSAVPWESTDFTHVSA